MSFSLDATTIAFEKDSSFLSGRDFWLGNTQDIKMGSCVFQCKVPHQWIAQNRPAVCLYPVTVWGGMSCVCILWQGGGGDVLCLNADMVYSLTDKYCT